MFVSNLGPDICGPGTKKVHVIFNYKGKNVLINKDIRCKVSIWNWEVGVRIPFHDATLMFRKVSHIIVFLIFYLILIHFNVYDFIVHQPSCFE